MSRNFAGPPHPHNHHQCSGLVTPFFFFLFPDIYASNGHHKVQEIHATSYVGFDSITQQIEYKILKRGFQFNVIIVCTSHPPISLPCASLSNSWIRSHTLSTSIHATFPSLPNPYRWRRCHLLLSIGTWVGDDCLFNATNTTITTIVPPPSPITHSEHESSGLPSQQHRSSANTSVPSVHYHHHPPLPPEHGLEMGVRRRPHHSQPICPNVPFLTHLALILPRHRFLRKRHAMCMGQGSSRLSQPI